MVKKVTSKTKRKAGPKKVGVAPEKGLKIQSAAQLGIMATKLGVKKKATTHRGRKIMEKRESKAQENPKRCMIMKGRKSSATINDLLKDLQLMKGRERVQMLVRHTHDIVPMEDPSLIEN